MPTPSRSRADIICQLGSIPAGCAAASAGDASSSLTRTRPDMLGKLRAPTVTPVTSTVCAATSRPSASVRSIASESPTSRSSRCAVYSGTATSSTASVAGRRPRTTLDRSSSRVAADCSEVTTWSESLGNSSSVPSASVARPRNSVHMASVAISGSAETCARRSGADRFGASRKPKLLTCAAETSLAWDHATSRSKDVAARRPPATAAMLAPAAAPRTSTSTSLVVGPLRSTRRHVKRVAPVSLTG